MQHKNKGTLCRKLFGEHKSNLCPCSRVLQHFLFKTDFICKTDGTKLRRKASSACKAHALYCCFSKGSRVLYPQLYHGLDFAEVVTTSLSYSNSADGYEFVQAEEGTEHKSNLLNKYHKPAVSQNVGQSNNTSISGCSF